MPLLSLLPKNLQNALGSVQKFVQGKKKEEDQKRLSETASKLTSTLSMFNPPSTSSSTITPSLAEPLIQKYSDPVQQSQAKQSQSLLTGLSSGKLSPAPIKTPKLLPVNNPELFASNPRSLVTPLPTATQPAQAWPDYQQANPAPAPTSLFTQQQDKQDWVMKNSGAKTALGKTFIPYIEVQQAFPNQTKRLEDTYDQLNALKESVQQKTVSASFQGFANPMSPSFKSERVISERPMSVLEKPQPQDFIVKMGQDLFTKYATPVLSDIGTTGAQVGGELTKQYEGDNTLKGRAGRLTGDTIGAISGVGRALDPSTGETAVKRLEHIVIGVGSATPIGIAITGLLTQPEAKPVVDTIWGTPDNPGFMPKLATMIKNTGFVQSLSPDVKRNAEDAIDFATNVLPFIAAHQIYKGALKTPEMVKSIGYEKLPSTPGTDVYTPREWLVNTKELTDALKADPRKFIQDNFGYDIMTKRPGFIAPGEMFGMGKTELKSTAKGISKPGVTSPAPLPADVAQGLREAKGLSAEDIVAKFPDLNLKREVQVTDIYGKKSTIDAGEALTPYELKGNKILLQDGETYIVSKNQFQNIKGNAVSGEAKEFAPELKGTEETVKGKDAEKTYKIWNDLVKELVANKEYNPTGRLSINDIKNNLSQADKTRLDLAHQESDSARLNGTKYSQYQLPGGRDYKEIIIRAPDTTVPYSKENVKSITNDPVYNDNARYWYFQSNDNVFQIAKSKYATEAEALDYVIKEKKPRSTAFESSHWPGEKNPISHVRIKIYDDPKLDQVSFMEELQSDWAREGRSKGFEDLAAQKEFNAYHSELRAKYKGIEGINEFPTFRKIVTPEELAKFDKLQQLAKGDIPSNTLLKNWQEMSVKRALQEAVNNGSEYFAWINGEQTSARYNLAKDLDNVNWRKYETNSDKSFVHIVPKEGMPIDLTVDKNGKVLSGGDSFVGKRLDEVLGKGLADSIMSKENGTLKGEGLKFGGEWANTLYDKQVANIVKDLTGAKVEVLDMGLDVGTKTDKFHFVDPKDGGFIKDVKPKDLVVGLEIIRDNGKDFVVTDVLGDGKFKAVPKSQLAPEDIEAIRNNTLDAESRDILETDAEGLKETFDISTKKSAGQQGIKITPEIRAMVKGEAPALKQPSGKSPYATRPSPTAEPTGFAFKNLPEKGKKSIAEQAAEKVAIDEFEIPEEKRKSIRKLVQEELSPLKNVDGTTKQIYTDWTIRKSLAKESGRMEAEKLTNIPEKGSWQTILEYQRGDKTPYRESIKKAFDDVRFYAQDNGLDVGYRENYIPQVYKENPQEVQVAMAKFLKDQGVNAEDITLYLSGIEPLSDSIVKRIGLNPSFTKERVFPNYETAMKYGINPKYTHPAQLLGNYKQEVNNALANRKLLSDLQDSGRILLPEDAPANWEPVKLPLGQNMYFAEPQLAKVLNDKFSNPANRGLGEVIISGIAKTSRLAQEIALSAGIPYTDVNFFTIGQLIKEMTAGNFKAVVPFIRANFGEATVNYFKENQKYIIMMENQGIDMSRRIGSIESLYDNTVKNDSIAKRIGGEFGRAFNAKTFSNFMPQLYVQTFKDAYTKALRKGIANPEKVAGDMTKKFFGMTEDLGRTKGTENALSAVFFAPKFREGLIKAIWNVGRSVTVDIRNPAFSKSRKLFAGMVISLGLYELLNKKLSGHYMHDNAPGKELALEIPMEDGTVIYVEFMPSFLAFARNMATGTIALAKGDTKTALQKYGSVFSMPIKITTEILSNSDYFGREIYKDTDSTSEKAAKIALYTGLAVNHPYIKEFINQWNEKIPLYQSIIYAMELPLRFSTKDKIAATEYYRMLDKKTQERADINKTFTPKYEEIVSLIDTGKTDEAQKKLEDLSDADYEIYKNMKSSDKRQATNKIKVEMYQVVKDVKRLVADGKTDQAQKIIDDLTDEEYKAYKSVKNNLPKEKKSDERSSLGIVSDYTRAFLTDPSNAWKALTTKEELGIVKGNLVEMKRFYGIEYDEKGGSQEYKKKRMEEMGIPWSEEKNYKLEHITPVKAGGDTSDANLLPVTNELHDFYTPIEAYAIRAVQKGTATRKEVEELMIDFKINKTISAEQVIAALK